jgi:hypothetical protein
MDAEQWTLIPDYNTLNNERETLQSATKSQAVTSNHKIQTPNPEC